MIKDIDATTRSALDRDYSLVFDYLRQVGTQSPPDAIVKLQNLLKFSKNEDSQVLKAIEKIIFSKKQLDVFFSQCCYQILECWVAPESIASSLKHVWELLASFEVVCQGNSYDRRRKQLAQRLQGYFRSESYLRLKTVVNTIHPRKNNDPSLTNSFATNGDKSSNSLINATVESHLLRYTCLYPYLLPPEITAPNLLGLLKALQYKRQQDFEIMLSQHIIYRFRLKQLAKMKLMAKGAGKMITKADNPSLLSEPAFRTALQQCIGEIENGNTVLERSQLFIAENEYRPDYKRFKQDLYQFLVSNIKPRNTTYRFNNHFKKKLRDIFANSDDKPLNKTLILQTCRQLYSYLIINPANNDSRQFTEAISNLGTAQVMLVLLKIVLICPESKADLEKKIYAVAIQHQSKTVREAAWLLKCLEHLTIAFSIYFGKIDVSIAKSAMSKSQ